MTTPNQADLLKIRQSMQAALAQQLEREHVSPAAASSKLTEWFDKLIQRSPIDLSIADKDTLRAEIISELIGFGPLQQLIDDDDINEIMVNGPKQVYIEKNGNLSDTAIQFDDDQHIYRVIDRIIRPLGRTLDWDHPMVDARLPDGSRVNIIVPPIAIDGPCITIRKFQRHKYNQIELVDLGTLTPYMIEFLQACVTARLNILVSGNTSSGKTTLLNLLSSFIPDDERIITIEDAAELALKQKYVVRLETRQTNASGKGLVETRDLVRNALRMRPDRIVVGEVRSGEALDMLQAMNTGHTGSLTTLHANTPRDAISRLETMAMMSGVDMPLMALRKQIAAAIHLIVHMARLEDGTRKVTFITEVAGMEGDVVTLSDIFKFDRKGITARGQVTGELRPTRIRPLFVTKLEAAGIKLRPEIFGAGQF